MFIAADAHGSYTVAADTGTRGTLAYCPRCGNELTLRTPQRRAPHFAHHPGQACRNPHTARRTPRASRTAPAPSMRAQQPAAPRGPLFPARRSDPDDLAGQQALF